jgi:tripartite-type tricarboxylate transporter receptor subunit TctC
MKLIAHRWLATVLLAASPLAWSQAYPTKPVRLIVPYPAGTVTDLVARRLSDRAAIGLGQPIVVENRAGAAATVGAQAVARASPDGYTLLFGTNQTHATNSMVLKNQGYDAKKDFTPIARLVVNSQVLAVSAELGVKSLQELIALAKAKPGTLSFVSAGRGTTAHLAGEYFKSLAGLDLTHVPYNSAQLMTDLISGRTSMIIYPYVALKPHIQSGKLIPLATLGTTRPDWMRNVPTMVEAGFPDLVFVSWFALYGPANLAQGVAKSMSDAYCRVLSDRETAAGLVTDGSEPSCTGPAELAEFNASEIERVQRVVKKSQLTFDE